MEINFLQHSQGWKFLVAYPSSKSLLTAASSRVERISFLCVSSIQIGFKQKVCAGYLLLALADLLSALLFVHYINGLTLWFLVGLINSYPSRRGDGWREESKDMVLISRLPSCSITSDRLFSLY